MILIIAIVLTFVLAIIQSLLVPSLNVAGLPFAFGTYSIFGSAMTDKFNLFLDIIFWFIILFALIKGLSNFIKRN